MSDNVKDSKHDQKHGERNQDAKRGGAHGWTFLGCFAAVLKP